MSTRRYWARFFLALVLGTLLGLLVGEIVEASTGVAGWALISATAGFVAGLAAFLFLSDT